MTTTLKPLSNGELQSLHDEALANREKHRELEHKGQNPSFWTYEIERQKILREMERRKVQVKG